MAGETYQARCAKQLADLAARIGEAAALTVEATLPDHLRWPWSYGGAEPSARYDTVLDLIEERGRALAAVKPPRIDEVCQAVFDHYAAVREAFAAHKWSEGAKLQAALKAKFDAWGLVIDYTEPKA